MVLILRSVWPLVWSMEASTDDMVPGWQERKGNQ